MNFLVLVQASNSATFLAASWAFVFFEGWFAHFTQFLLSCPFRYNELRWLFFFTHFFSLLKRLFLVTTHQQSNYNLSCQNVNWYSILLHNRIWIMKAYLNDLISSKDTDRSKAKTFKQNIKNRPEINKDTYSINYPKIKLKSEPTNNGLNSMQKRKNHQRVHTESQ